MRRWRAKWQPQGKPGSGREGAVGKFGRETELCNTVLCERPGSDQETGNGAVSARLGRIGGE